ncbi:hypothetical protein AGMMS4957_00370 [Bacteroidia bacterium]|nr:hypothetical protein AGMMS4957_00370 [Bacteroidia bacterium]
MDKSTATPPQDAILVHPGDSIQEVIDKYANTGKWIVLTEGVHTLSKTLMLKSGITLAGQGKKSILVLSPRASGQTIANAERDMHDVVIRDLLLEGATNTVTNNDPNHDRRNRSYMNAPAREGILFFALTDGQMKNIRFENLTVQNCTRSGVSVLGASGVKVIHCDFSDNGASVVPGAGFHHNLHLSHVNNCEVQNSRFDTSPWGNGINLTFARDVIITGNEAARNQLSGIRCTESENVQVINNLTEGNDASGISFDTQMDGLRKITVKDNLSQNNGAYGIYIGKAEEALVEGNTTVANYFVFDVILRKN